MSFVLDFATDSKIKIFITCDGCLGLIFDPLSGYYVTLLMQLTLQCGSIPKAQFGDILSRMPSNFLPKKQR